MSFRLVRVKRRADQCPVEALYVQGSIKRSKEETGTGVRIFKLVNRDAVEQKAFRTSAQDAKVVLLTEPTDMATVAEAVLCDDSEALKTIQKPSFDDSIESLALSEDANASYVYDLYKVDLGRYTEADIKANMAGIVYYEQELVHEEELTESDHFEDENDSNAEDFYANDYPEEESDYFCTSEESEWSDGYYSDRADFFSDYTEEE